MINFSEQFFANRQSQIEAQLAFFSQASARAVENTEKLLELNLRTSREALDKSAAALQQLFAAQDPRDLIALSTQGQQHFDSLMAYGQALIGIAAGAQEAQPQPAAAPFPEAQLALPLPKAAKKK